MLVDESDEEGHAEVEGVQRADVIHYPRLVHHEHEHEHSKIEAPHHVNEATEAKVAGGGEVDEIPVARHPHVSADEDADHVVDARRRAVVIHDEEPLHPALPLFGL